MLRAVRCAALTHADVKTQEELEQLELQDVIPHVGIDYIKHAIKAERSGDWSTLDEHRCLTAWVVTTLKKCVQEATSNDAKKFDVLTNCDVEEH